MKAFNKVGRHRVWVVFTLAAVMALSLTGLTAAQEPITVAVMEMEFRGGGQWGQMDVSRQMTALITDGLVDDGNFLVIERDQIDAILGEQNFGASDRIDPSRAAEIGRLLGADALIFGTVTKFEFSSTGGISFGGISLSGTSAEVELTGRVVDTTQGVIRGSVSGAGKATGGGISVQNLQGLSFNASQFQETALGKATFEAVDDIVGKLSRTIDRQADDIRAAKSRGEVTGTVVALIDGGVVINIGQQAGIRAEQRLTVYRLLTVEGLAEPVRIPVGEVRVISVDAQAAVAVFESETQPAEVGDSVAFQ